MESVINQSRRKVMEQTEGKQELRTRRDFLKEAGVATAFLASGAGKVFAQPADNPKGANERIGIGFIGCGGRGGWHLDLLAQMKAKGANIEIVAVCDTYTPRMKACAEKLKVGKMYKDHRELVADPAVDLVGIATPDHLHGFQALDAVRAGKAVYCEKPLTHWRQFELTKQLAHEVRNSKVAFQVGAQGMSDSAWHQMRKLVKEGLIGQPIHAECGYFRVGDWGERGMPIPDPNAQSGPDLNWDAFLADAPKRPFDVSRYFRWRMYEDYSGGPCTDLFPHSLSPVISILGVTMPSCVVATGGKFRYEEREVPDTFNMLIDYPEKITVAVLGTQGNNYNATGGRGAPGRVPVVRGWEGTLTIEGQEVVFVPAEQADKTAQRFPVERPESTEYHWQNLFDCMKSGEPTESPMDLGYYVQTALQMGMLGHREGKVARFDREAEKIIL
jgi:predicted dehydrogenase